MVSRFTAGEERWRAGLGTLRQVVRHEVVARQLTTHLSDSPALRILDVGCGQGTQALRLAQRGHRVTGLDSSETLLGDFERSLATEPAEVRARVRTVQRDAGELADVFEAGSFDAVLCHGVLMYMDDPAPLLDDLTRLVTPHGVLSLLVRNGDGLAMRPGMFGEWMTALESFEDLTYYNRIGVSARADRLDDLTASLAARGMNVTAWYGVRVFTDIAATDAVVPDEDNLAVLLACEERAGKTDPYRRVASLTHVIAERA
ncbi:MAG TPA: methyltransferase domain-containing protein [Pseudonocardiaceae bacterium]|nr:methyltransferase domain-containing protein [Pseudonocardiaceae bacterium]